MDSELIDAHSFLTHSLSGDGRGTEDPDDPQTVQAMQIALHIPKAEPPERSDVLAAAAKAVVAVCLDPRAAQPGAWHDALAQWYGHRIRKIARRARGAGWENVQALPGCTAVSGTAAARAFIPSAVSEVPTRLRNSRSAAQSCPQMRPVIVIQVFRSSRSTPRWG